MKTKINKLSIIVLASILLLFGCSKDFLDTKPKGVIPPQDFYKTDKDGTEAVMACYNMLQAFYSTPWQNVWMLKALASGDLYSGGAKQDDQPAADEINQFKYESNNAIIRDTYSQAYYIIYRANMIIDNLPGDDAYQKAVIAEAKTIRAYVYFELTTLWGPVPLVIHELVPGEYQQPNADVTALWAQIEKDLTEAIPDLPVKSEMEAMGMDISRVSKGTAQSLLGKSLLFEKKYSEAATMLQNVIDSKEYSLNPDYSQILRKSSEFGTESIFEISFSSAKNNDWSTPAIWNNPVRTAMDNRIWQLFGPRGDEGFNGGNSGINGGWGFGYPSFYLYNDYVAAGDTVRRKATIMTEDELIAKGGSYRNADGNYPWGCTGLVRLKYATWADETVSTGVAELNYGTNVRVIRYADVLLMAAEAYNRSQQDAKALPLINEVRARVNLPALSLGGDALFTAIKTERELELSYEGVRFQDLVRWGDAATVLGDFAKTIPTGQIVNGQLQWKTIDGAGFKARNVLFPFPFDELTTNSKITQNTGY